MLKFSLFFYIIATSIVYVKIVKFIYILKHKVYITKNILMEFYWKIRVTWCLRLQSNRPWKKRLILEWHCDNSDSDPQPDILPSQWRTSSARKEGWAGRRNCDVRRPDAPKCHRFSHPRRPVDYTYPPNTFDLTVSAFEMGFVFYICLCISCNLQRFPTSYGTREILVKFSTNKVK